MQTRAGSQRATLLSPLAGEENAAFVATAERDQTPFYTDIIFCQFFSALSE